jgi:hypothetical protein
MIVAILLLLILPETMRNPPANRDRNPPWTKATGIQARP